MKSHGTSLNLVIPFFPGLESHVEDNIGHEKVMENDCKVMKFYSCLHK